MFISGHPVLLHILITYSILFLLRSKSRNEFLLVFTLFMFFIETNRWENEITSLTTTPIRTKPSDIALIIMVFYILIRSKSIILSGDNIVKIFSIFVLISTFIGLLRFGYSAIAEFRSIFFFLIIMLFILSNVKKFEIPILIKKISTYLMPLILLVPLNLVLTKNFSINVENRQLSAFMYTSIVLGFVGGFFYHYYYDKKFKLPLFLLPVLFLMLPYTSHRTTWAAMLIMLPFALYFLDIKKSTIFVLSLFAITILSFNIDIIYYFQERSKAFTNIQEDPTGSWRLLVWNAVLRDATLLGKGIGARWEVYAERRGWEALAGAHNGYILILYYLGYLGVFMLLIFLIYLTITLFSHSIKKTNNASEKMIYRLGFVSVLSLLTYMMGYEFDVVSIIFISFALLIKSKKLKTIP